MANIITKINRKIGDYIGSTQGTAGEDFVAGVRQPRPYTNYYSDGIFKAANNKLWVYFKMPTDVKVEWTKTYREAAENQQFLSNIFNVLGDSLNYSRNADSTTRKDERIGFHIPIIREVEDSLIGYADATPAMDNFIDRMSGTIGEHTVWHSYLGIEVPIGDINMDIYKFSDKVKNFVNHAMGKTDQDLLLYSEYLRLIRSVCFDNGMRPLDFSVDSDDFDRLVGWFGQNDHKYGIRPELPTTPMYLPVHGKSVFAGGREMMMSSIRPRESESMFTKDPFDAFDVRFGEILMRPSLDIAHINIRGQIRSTVASANLFDQKITKREIERSDEKSTDVTSSSYAERKKLERDNYNAYTAAGVAEAGNSLLDNVEMTVASIVKKKNVDLNSALKPARLEAVNITGRHHIALCSTVPGYPDPIYRVSASNEKRNPNVRVFFSGVLAMSGLFRSVKPASNEGILLGLSEAGFEMKEIYMNPTTTDYPPTVFVSGSTGSGKTIQLLMMNAQNTYLGGQSIYLNPKPGSSLKPFFDYLGGVTINMSTKYLKERPGLLDPMFYIEDREEVGRLLADMIIRATGMNETTNNRYEAVRAMEDLTANLIENANYPANETSFDVIFGNQRHGANTKPLRDKEIVKFVRTKLKSSPFWKASISNDPGARNTFAETFNSNKPLLIEWDKSIVLPERGKTALEMTPQENDGVQSIVNLFMYSSEVIGRNKSGGILTIDEAYVLKSSNLIMQQAIKSGRTWRDKNRTLLLASQHLADFLPADSGSGTSDDLGAYIRSFLIMNIDENDHDDLDIFFRVSGLPRDEDTISYITSMKRNPKKGRFIPSAYYIDKEYDWEGSILCGPWPQREMRAAKPQHGDITEEISGAIDQMNNVYETSSIDINEYNKNIVDTEDERDATL